MSKADTCHTVLIKGHPVRGEYVSGVTLTVGMVVQLDSHYELALSAVASAYYSGGECVVMEAPERGKGIYSSGTTETTYVAGEQVPTLVPARGDEVLVLLTSGETITRGGLLDVAATAKCVAASGSKQPAYRAMESLSPSQDALIWVQRL